MRTMFILLFILLFALPLKATVGIGNYVSYAGYAQTDKEGGTKSFEFAPYLSLHHLFNIKGPHYFHPEIGYAFHTGQKDETSKNTILLLYTFSYRYKQFFFRYGLGNIITKISGKGGTIELNDGSSTSTFYVPEESETSYVGTLNFGVEGFVQTKYSLRFDGMVLTPLSSDKRKFSYALSVNYYH